MRTLMLAGMALIGVLVVGPLVAREAAAADVKTIAIMPLDPVPGNTVPAAISGGVHTAVAGVLAQDPEFKVASDNLTGKYFGKDFTAASAAKDLGVRFIFMGSIDGDEPTAHVTAVLVDTSNGTQLFKGSFFSDPMNVDSFHVEIASSIKLAFLKAGL